VEAENAAEENEDTASADVFVSATHDHCYSLHDDDQQRGKAEEVAVVVAHEEVVHEESHDGEESPSSPAGQPSAEVQAAVIQPTPACTPIEAAPSLATSVQLAPVTFMAPARQPSFLYSPAPMIVRAALPSSCKLPLPRLKDGAPSSALPLVQTVSVSISPMANPASNFSLPKVVKKRKRRWKKKPREVVEQELAAKKARMEARKRLKGAAAKPSVEEDPSKVDSHLPEAILASEDPEEANGDEEIIETIDLTSERGGDEEDDDVVEEPVEASTENPVAVNKATDSTKTGKEETRPMLAHGKTRVGKGRRSKSSYSIAALCQISVNIGADPSAASVSTAMVDSPGVVSLNSVGTNSPAGTPAPTPTPPAAAVPSRPAQSSTPSLSRSACEKEQATATTERPKVIQELTSPKDVAKEKTTGESVEDVLESLAEMETSQRAETTRVEEGNAKKSLDLSVFDFTENDKEAEEEPAKVRKATNKSANLQNLPTTTTTTSTAARNQTAPVTKARNEIVTTPPAPSGSKSTTMTPRKTIAPSNVSSPTSTSAQAQPEVSRPIDTGATRSQVERVNRYEQVRPAQPKAPSQPTTSTTHHQPPVAPMQSQQQQQQANQHQYQLAMANPPYFQHQGAPFGEANVHAQSGGGHHHYQHQLSSHGHHSQRYQGQPYPVPLDYHSPASSAHRHSYYPPPSATHASRGYVHAAQQHYRSQNYVTTAEKTNDRKMR